jgi:FG-GAP-like repeat
MIRSSITTTTSGSSSSLITRGLRYFIYSSLFVISLTNAQTQEPAVAAAEPPPLTRIVNQTTVATNILGSIDNFLVSNYGRRNDILAGGSAGFTLFPNNGVDDTAGGTANISFGPAQPVVITSGGGAGRIECMCDGDFNGDGLDDFVYALDDDMAALRIALQNSATGTFDTYNLILASNGAVTLPMSGIALGRAIGRSVKVADMDGDGDYDIIATLSGADDQANIGALLYLRNSGNGINYEISYLDESLGGIAIVRLGDLDEDDRVDITVMGVDSRQLAVYYNEAPLTNIAIPAAAGGNFTKQVLDTAAESNMCIAIGDFNDYSNPDIVAIGTSTIHFYLNNFGRNYQKWNMFDYTPAPDASTNYHHFSCALYDMDGNGLMDIVYTQGLQGKQARYASNNVEMSLNDYKTDFRKTSTGPLFFPILIAYQKKSKIQSIPSLLLRTRLFLFFLQTVSFFYHKHKPIRARLQDPVAWRRLLRRRATFCSTTWTAMILRISFRTRSVIKPYICFLCKSWMNMKIA